MQTLFGKASKKEASKTSPWSVSSQTCPNDGDTEKRPLFTFHHSPFTQSKAIPASSFFTLVLFFFLSLQEVEGQIYAILYNTTTQKNNLYAYSLATNTWTAKAVTPVTLNGYSRLVCVGAYIYCSGFSTGTFLRYDILQDSWSAMASRPVIPNLTYTAYADIAYSDGTYIYTNQHQNTMSNGMIDRYNISTNTWDSILTPAFPPTSPYLGLEAIIDGIMYGVVENGTYTAYFSGGSATGAVHKNFKYDPVTRVSTLTPNPLLPSTDFVTAGRMVVVGGTSIYFACSIASWLNSNSINYSVQYYKYFAHYNTLTNTWTTLAIPPFPISAQFFELVYDGSNIYAMATNTPPGSNVTVPNILYKYNITTNSWSSVTGLPASNVFGGFGMAVYATANQSLTVTPATQTANKGEIVTYTYKLSNKGGFADGVTAKIKTPAGLTLLSATAQQGTYNNNTKIWDVGTMGETSKTLVMKLKVD